MKCMGGSFASAYRYHSPWFRSSLHPNQAQDFYCRVQFAVEAIFLGIINDTKGRKEACFFWHSWIVLSRWVLAVHVRFCSSSHGEDIKWHLNDL
eukprot:scaffold17829_cov202-Amphora_coffeaeformis.AAC.1